VHDRHFAIGRTGARFVELLNGLVSAGGTT
jgi:hypothetical protein